ncbi:pyridoxamine 5'-phosphate oxidase family protein [Polycladomyces subterraneus]|uniref:Pyridoxamine 5'-phosphate oxidase family protein n=1 Tax=Polycladomyces subterraneus TaxID=1016997 RepID=A0ABT8IKU2_9BACL|nr:pyridoxamine 5'-phosphate oxidase family protein [Polycladomyces subterraneus]MDN4593335.1 pyridoxamine 5'-phosphate oxidase family protein [Polycladomyces subterraneus]
MKILRTLSRMYVEDLSASVTHYEQLLQEPVRHRFRDPQTNLEYAWFHNMVLAAGSQDAVSACRNISITFVVDSIMDFKYHLKDNGARIIREPYRIPIGLTMLVEKPGGSIVEYVEVQKEGNWTGHTDWGELVNKLRDPVRIMRKIKRLTKQMLLDKPEVNPLPNSSTHPSLKPDTPSTTAVPTVTVPKPTQPAQSTFLPGSNGEHLLQERYGTTNRALNFYNKQMLDHLNDVMKSFIADQEMMFIATADGHGECDCSFRAGPPGFVHVLDEKTLIYPEYRGNGVMASLGNILENPHIGIIFIDFFQHAIGLHINGKAEIIENDVLMKLANLPEQIMEELNREGFRKPERWVLVEVEEAYIHCSKHIPLLKKLDKEIEWGTDDVVRKGGDFFKAKDCPRPWIKETVPSKTGTN